MEMGEKGGLCLKQNHKLYFVLSYRDLIAVSSERLAVDPVVKPRDDIV